MGYFVGDEDTWFFVGLIFRICLLLSFWLLVQIEVGLLLEDLQKSPCRRMLCVELRFVLLYPRMSIVHRPKDCGPVPFIALFAFLFFFFFFFLHYKSQKKKKKKKKKKVQIAI